MSLRDFALATLLVACAEPADGVASAAAPGDNEQARTELAACRADLEVATTERDRLAEAVLATARPASTEVPAPDAPSAPPVLTPTRSRVRDNIIGTPELQVTVQNETSRAIDGFRFWATCYDNFGDEQPSRVGRDARFRGSSDAAIRGRQERSVGWWTLYDFPLCTSARVTITEVHFVDGERWVGEAAQAADAP